MRFGCWCLARFGCWSLVLAFKREVARQDLIVSVVLGDTETTS
jgi:hypothetical protein